MSVASFACPELKKLRANLARSQAGQTGQFNNHKRNKPKIT